MEQLKIRKSPLASKIKMANAMRLYERYVDEPIQSIKIWSSCSYEFEGSCNRYNVDISNNKVQKIYPDIE
jgi:hypothetical protein